MDNSLIYQNLIDKVNNIETSLNIISISDTYLLVVIIVVIVCYLIYKAIDNFISF